ncbi:hypothetical protein HYFRA_00002010 [Hymenoscyphus fraxineus]|uniref:Uncharacterized protein n=1 Tax=Hymenoscyphus fraxineus TaxID=746836 RepID=A0A9N9KL30_9HELO|nr:hypothetical protein HYFRA_00002010 [Hymenoscyphus fraxineus]
MRKMRGIRGNPSFPLRGVGTKSRMGFRTISTRSLHSRRPSIFKLSSGNRELGSSSRVFSCELRGIGRRGLLTQSYCKGPNEPPLLTQTIPEHFEGVAGENWDGLAVISRASASHPVQTGRQNEASKKEAARNEASQIAPNLSRLTYGDLHHLSNSMAMGLQDRGVRKGDRVAVSLGNGWEFAVASYAIWKLGAILVPLNPSFNAPQVIAALTHLDGAHLIIGTETNLPFKPSRGNMSLLKELVPDLTSGGNLQSPTVPSLKNLFLVDNSDGRIDTSTLRATIPFLSLFNKSTSSMKVTPDSPLSPDDIINIQFTSGTTSAPKAASLTHRSILNNGFQIGSRMDLTPKDIICCPPPLFHCFGSILGYMATATHGSTILFPAPAFDPAATLLAVQEEKATGLYGVPTMFTAYLELLSSGKISREGFQYLRTGIAAGSSIPSHLMSRLTKELNLDGLTICYGMTETSPVSCMTFPTDPLEKRLHTVGRLLPHVEAKIVTPSNSSNDPLPIDIKGELLISGYNVMTSYFNSPTQTAAVLQPDTHGQIWMRTGDEAVMDSEGYVSITGRIKDLIIRGGENIHPLEIEDCLLGMPGVSAVSVVGLPDERYGEVVGVFVVPCEGWGAGADDLGVCWGVGEEGKEGKGGWIEREDVREWVRGKLSAHLVPKYVFWSKDFPKTASGKK